MIATADVVMMQVQIVDKNGEIRAIAVWRCGPDVYWAETMDGLFDNARRKKAPEWLLEQLDAVPQDKRFDAYGKVKGVTTVQKEVTSPSAVPHLPSSDTDLPGFVQA